MFIKEEKKEHPEIVQEEREIRENLQNIRKEAKDVEHILEDDLLYFYPYYDVCKPP